MNARRERCIGELADASVDALLYAAAIQTLRQDIDHFERMLGLGRLQPTRSA
jgi:hypothetical protein